VYASQLSGGERRRLYLLTVLMKNPNFLILDEPTNDLDIMTLNVLEDYLVSFGGCVVVVSHDRFFMDKIVDHLFVFEGNGVVTDFPGNYTIYRNKIEAEQELEKIQAKKKEPEKKTIQSEPAQPGKRKITFNEKRELETLETEIAQLEVEKSSTEESLNSGNCAHDELFRLSQRLVIIKSLLDEKELRWLELSELV